jgi:4-amino-4-deoxy-L-arabinose transferase-like glycosyltransferase
VKAWVVPVHNHVLKFQPAARRLAFVAMIGLISALYLANLTGMGLVSADEPRYAAIGRAMAVSGDWVTPRLWGQPWFEKPALLYWMTACAFRLGLGPDLAPRLPIALLSLAFLVFFWWRLRIEWGARAAWFATAMLATSAGWLAFSHVAVTDLPLAVFFSASLLLSMPWIARGERSMLPAAAACLGIATLAKGLVPLVLFLPVLAIGWRSLRDWIRPGPVLAFGVVALPWYVLCTIRNGSEFPRVFFVQQTFARVGSPELQHVQPVWFYVPVLLLLLYPWFPLLIFPGRGFSLPARDPRIRTLAAVVVFGFIFFSAVLNKLPGYLLPLIPQIFMLMGIGLARVSRPGVAIVAPVLLLGALPLMAAIAPGVLAHGLRSMKIPWQGTIVWLIAAGIVGIILASILRKHAFAAAAVLACAGFLWFEMAAFPGFDAVVSARPLWLAGRLQCAPQSNRSTLYGLYYYSYYYSGKRLPNCTVLDQTTTRVVR